METVSSTCCVSEGNVEIAVSGRIADDVTNKVDVTLTEANECSTREGNYEDEAQHQDDKGTTEDTLEEEHVIEQTEEHENQIVEPLMIHEDAQQQCIAVDIESIRNIIPNSSSNQAVINLLLSQQANLNNSVGTSVSSSVATQTDANSLSILAEADGSITCNLKGHKGLADGKPRNHVKLEDCASDSEEKDGITCEKDKVHIELSANEETIGQETNSFLTTVGGELNGQLGNASGFEVTAFVADDGQGGHIIISGSAAYQDANTAIPGVQEQLREIPTEDGQLVSSGNQEREGVNAVTGLEQFSSGEVQMSSESVSEGDQTALHYVLHQDVASEGDLQYVDANMGATKKLYQCAIDGCHKQFSTPYRLKAHGRTHTGETFQCDEEGCHKTFITPSDLHKHLKTHSGEKPFLCEFEGCGKVYTTSHHLKVHKRSHSGEKPFICEWDNCGRSFSTGYGLKSHFRTHTGERPYKCPEPDCVKAFKTSGDLQKHVRTHTGERPFKCPYDGCGRSFTTSNIRKVHLRTHTGEKPYVCEFESCGRAFASATNYKNHSRIHTGERPYVCEVPGCNKRFTEYSSLYKHNVVHTQQKPYECEICHKNYRQTSTLAMHRRTVHGTTEDSIDETSDAGCNEEIIDGNEPAEKRHKIAYEEAAQVATALVQGLPVMVSDEAAATALQTQYAELAATQQLGDSGSLPGAIAIPIQVTMNADGTIAGAQGINIADVNGRLIPVSLSMSLAISSFTMTPLVETSHGLEVGSCDVSQIYQDPQTSLGSHLVTAHVLPEQLAGQEVIDEESTSDDHVSKENQEKDATSSQGTITTAALPHHLLVSSATGHPQNDADSIKEIGDVAHLSTTTDISQVTGAPTVLGEENPGEGPEMEVLQSENSILVTADHEEPDVTDRYLTKSNLSVKS